jgi:cation diffusion facilitator CzcD-associated flavoprotein CzcO
LKYFTDVVKDHGLAKYIHLSHSVISAEWQDQEGLWKVQIEKPDGSQTTEYCNVFISATGFLSSWDWPKVPGFENFKGQKVHTADYPSDLEVAGKRVAVLGAGSSAVQVIATIMPEVAKLYTWVRSPVWVSLILLPLSHKPNFRFRSRLRMPISMQDQRDQISNVSLCVFFSVG